MENEIKKVCDKCGSPNTDGNKFCMQCGNSLVIEKAAEEPVRVEETPRCINCGEELPAGAVFCAKCGTAQTAEKAADNPTAPAQASPSPAVAGTAPAPVEKKPTNKKLWITIASVLAVLAIAGGVFAYINSLPKSIIKDVKVSFSGYNTMGTANISGNYENKEMEIIGKKVGFSSSDIQALEKGNLSSISTAIGNAQKLTQFEKYSQDVKVYLSKSDNLSNDNKVTLYVKTTLKDNPIKSESKEYTVKGLDKSSTYTLDDVLKSDPVKFTGWNHFGSIKSDSTYDINNDSSDSSSSSLTNGDKVYVKLNQSYVYQQQQKGRIFKGENGESISVTGLQDTPKISNLAELQTQEDTVARANNKTDTGDFGTTYTITRLDSYFVGTDISNWGSYDDNSSDGSFSVVTLYKIVSHYNSDTDNKNDQTNYEFYGYSGLQLTGDKVNVSALTDSNKYSGNSEDTQQAAIDDLKSDYASALVIK